MQASPIKLKSGDWGARVQGRASEGQTITIRTKGGKSWSAIVDRVIWRGDGVSIVATRSADTGGAPRRGIDYCGYACPVDGHRCTAANPCHDCR